VRHACAFCFAARVLGRSPRAVFREIHWPLLRPAILVASLLIFIDAIKELPATLLLRPLNVETLATQVYSEASKGTFENGSMAALMIVLAGVIPASISMRLFDQKPGKGV
jgi:iron(III) transport system permease protein